MSRMIDRFFIISTINNVPMIVNVYSTKAEAEAQKKFLEETFTMGKLSIREFHITLTNEEMGLDK